MTEISNVSHPPVLETVEELEAPDQAFRSSAALGPASELRHAALRDSARCLGTIRLRQPEQAGVMTWPLTAVAWNLERCKHVEESADLLMGVDPDICLLTEMDLGMARSGNRDTITDLAARLGMGHVFGVEFIELGKGDRREQSEHADTANKHGLHGNAILTRFAIDRAALLPLDAGGLWFREGAFGDQRRIGGRMAIAIRHKQPAPFWVISVHYESLLGPRERAAETEVLLAHIASLCGDEPILIGGDFNCKGLQEAGLVGEAMLDRPEQVEPMFQHLRAAGFSWRDCNTDGVTTRHHDWMTQKQHSLKKIDWFFGRGLKCNAPGVLAAVSPAGRNLSDHEAITVSVAG